MEKKKKRKRNSQKTQKKLLEAAEHVFVKKGFDGARVDEIAHEAGINKRMIYVFFGSKELLYLEVLRNSFTLLFHSNIPEPNPDEDIISDIEAIVRWYFSFLSENPNFVRLFSWETLHDGHRAGRVLLDLMGEGLGPLQAIVARGKEQGFFRKDLAAHKLVTIVHELCLGFFSRLRLYEVLWRRDLSDPKNQDEMLEHITKVLKEGICIKRNELIS
ncbi:MAG: TetR/AcrR family transcriptional regulator [Proteobacteria bacterium]|nr:TetR/AcrR family transcriptional regulator [Pseudomonadota bacterium]